MAKWKLMMTVGKGWVEAGLFKTEEAMAAAKAHLAAMFGTAEFFAVPVYK